MNVCRDCGAERVSRKKVGLCRDCHSKHHAEYLRGYRAALKTGARTKTLKDGTLSALVVDILETNFGSWWEWSSVAAEVTRIRGTADPEQVRGCLQKLAGDGLIQKRRAVRRTPMTYRGSGWETETVTDITYNEYRVPSRAYLREQ